MDARYRFRVFETMLLPSAKLPTLLRVGGLQSMSLEYTDVSGACLSLGALSLLMVLCLAQSTCLLYNYFSHYSGLGTIFKVSITEEVEG